MSAALYWTDSELKKLDKKRTSKLSLLFLTGILHHDIGYSYCIIHQLRHMNVIVAKLIHTWRKDL